MGGSLEYVLTQLADEMGIMSINERDKVLDKLTEHIKMLRAANEQEKAELLADGYTEDNFND